MRYKIFVNTETGGTLVFKNVESYTEEGSFIRFVDVKTGKIVLYPLIKCNIEEETK